jgi:hypothetical protein
MDESDMWAPNLPPNFGYPQGPPPFQGNFSVPAQGQTVFMAAGMTAPWPGPIFSNPPPIMPPPLLVPHPMPPHRQDFTRPTTERLRQPFPSTAPAAASPQPRLPYPASEARSGSGRGYRSDPPPPNGRGEGRKDSRRINQFSTSASHTQVGFIRGHLLILVFWIILLRFPHLAIITLLHCKTTLPVQICSVVSFCVVCKLL